MIQSMTGYGKTELNLDNTKSESIEISDPEPIRAMSNLPSF